MSAPKCSEYTVSAEQRRRLEEQARREREQAIREQEERRRILREQAIREQKTKAVKDKILSGINELRPLSGKLNDAYSKIADDLQKRSVNTNKLASDLKSFNTEITKLITTISNTNLQLEELEINYNKLTGLKSDIKAKYEVLDNAISETKNNLLKSLNENIYRGFENIKFNTDVKSGSASAQAQNDTSSQLNAELYKIKTHFMEMSAHEAISGELKDRLIGAVNLLSKISSADNLKNFRAITYSKIKKDYEDFIKDFEREELTRLLAEKEQEYIASCLDEVMVEMGYDLLGNRTVVKKNGRRFKNELYSFGNNDAVLNVTYSDDGKISMEVGNADKSDRVPTSYEAEKLVDEMKEFCSDFAKIENKLQEKGVLLKTRISHLPPTADNAQVINISDYDINDKFFNHRGHRGHREKQKQMLKNN